MTEKSRLFVLEPDLLSKIGHNYEAALRIAKSGADQGHSVTIIANQHFGLEPVAPLPGADVTILPYFARSFAYNVRELPDGAVKRPLPFDHHGEYTPWETYLLQLLTLDNDLVFGSNDLFYANTVTHPAAMAWTSFFQLLEPERRPKLYALVYSAPERIQGARVGDAGILDIMARMRAAGVLDRNIFFHVETKRLQERFAEEGFDYPVFMGPIPDAFFEPATQPDKPLTVGVIGEARQEKGFHLVPDILQHVLNSVGPERFAAIDFAIQVSTNNFNQNDRINKAKSKLGALAADFPNIRMLDEQTSQEYVEFLESVDVVLFPYLQEHYHTRGSGVAFEGLAGGKRFVTTPDIDVNETFADSGLYIAETPVPADYATALVECLDDIENGAIAKRGSGDELRQFGASTYFGTLTDRHRERLSRSALDTPAHAARGRCVYLCMSDFGGGIGFVQFAHCEALRTLGYDVIAIAIPWYTQSFEDFAKNRVTFYSNTLINGVDYAGIIPTTIGVKDGRSASRFKNIFRGHAFHEPYLHHNYAEFYDQVCFPTALIEEVLTRTDYDFVLTNYTFTLPLAKKFTKDGAIPLLFESNDVHSRQNAIRRHQRDERDAANDTQDGDAEEGGAEEVLDERQLETQRLRVEQGKAVERFDAADEIRTAALADVVLNLSEELETLYAEHCPKLRHRLLRPFVTDARRRSADPMPQPLSTLLLEQSATAIASAVPKIVAEPSPQIDLFFFGTDHLANNQSLDRFIETVFIPHLAPSGLKLFVAGSICDHLMQQDAAQRPDIVPIGRVADIRPFLFAAKVVVLYVSEGTGFPTKVIETLSYGQAFSVNQRALYELAEPAAGHFPVTTSAEEMGKDILALSADKSARTKRGAQGMAFYQETFSAAQYTQGFRSVLAGDLSIPTADLPTPDKIEFVHCENDGTDFDPAALVEIGIPLRPNIPLPFSSQSKVPAYLSGSWSHPEPSHVWVLDGEAGVLLSWAEETAPLEAIKAELLVAEPLVRKAVITVRLNGQILFQQTVSHMRNTLTLDVPASLQGAPRLHFLSFSSSETVKIGDDPRDLSLNVKSVTGLTSEQHARRLARRPALLLDEKIVFGRSGNAGLFVQENIDLSEDGFSWATDRTAKVGFRLPLDTEFRRMILRAGLIHHLVERKTRAKITVNGRPIFDEAVKTPEMLEFDLPLDNTEYGEYFVEFWARRKHRPNGDSRFLTWRLEEIEFQT